MGIVNDFFDACEVVGDGAINFMSPERKNESILMETDVLYGKEPCCTADIYYQKDKAGCPVLIYIHGGGFVGGDKKYRRGLCQWYAARGFFVINLNYGLSPQYAYPEPLIQLSAVFDFVDSLAEKFALNATKIIACGDSAGAFYAVALTILAERPDLQERLSAPCSNKISALVLNCGLYDVASAMQNKVPFDLSNRLLETITGHRFDSFEDYEYKDLCALLEFVDEKFPPCFVIYAEKDVLCGKQGALLLEKLQRCSVYCESFYSRDWLNNHCFALIWGNPKTRQVNRLVANFLDKFAKGVLGLPAAETVFVPGAEKAKKGKKTKLIIKTGQNIKKKITTKIKSVLPKQ